MVAANAATHHVACPAPQVGNNCAQTLADFMNSDKLNVSNVVGDGNRVIYTLMR